MKPQTNKKKTKKTAPKRVFMEYPYKGTLNRARMRKAISEVIAERANR